MYCGVKNDLLGKNKYLISFDECLHSIRIESFNNLLKLVKFELEMDVFI